MAFFQLESVYDRREIVCIFYVCNDAFYVASSVDVWRTSDNIRTPARAGGKNTDVVPSLATSGR